MHDIERIHAQEIDPQPRVLFWRARVFFITVTLIAFGFFFEHGWAGFASGITAGWLYHRHALEHPEGYLALLFYWYCNDARFERIPASYRRHFLQ